MWYTVEHTLIDALCEHSMRSDRRIILPIFLTLVAILAGCRQLPTLAILDQRTTNAIPLREIFEEQTEERLLLEKTARLDVDGDGVDEWIVFYRFDPYQNIQWANTPVHGIVYDALPCDPPVIREYRLPTPANDYLSEGAISVELQEVLREPGKSGSVPELVVFGGGEVKTLTFYRFFDNRTNFCEPVQEGQRGFFLLGFFRAISIVRDGTTIITKDRTVFERSQLAIKKIYRPREDPSVGQTYLQPDGRLVPPSEQTVDFRFDLPNDPRDSPYPEKTVATFYLALGSQNDLARSFLTEELQSGFETGTGLPIPVSQVGRVLIYSLSYTPDVAAEKRREDRHVEVVAAAVDKQGRLYPPRRLRWRLVGVPIPQRQDCEWRMAELVSVTTASSTDIPPGVARVVGPDS